MIDSNQTQTRLYIYQGGALKVLTEIKSQLKSCLVKNLTEIEKRKKNIFYHFSFRFIPHTLV